MNKKNLTYVSVAVGCLACLVSIFYVVQTIMELTSFSSELGTKYNTYVAVIGILFALAAVGFAFCAYKLLLPFFKKEESNDSNVTLTLIFYLAYETIINFVAMCFYGFNNSKCWVMVILGAVGLVLALLAALNKFDAKVKNVVLLIVAVLGFVLTIVGLVNAGGVSIATYIFTMLLLIAISAFYLCGLLIENGNSSK